ncbi:MAG: hypothetical protein J2P48_13310, partial [Alphaproteobacteria bacterium]|nr:hypothetical protein [Alphaproteobacteria bacterium]
SGWAPAVFISLTLGFFVPFFALITRPGKRSRVVVATVCVLVLLGRLADKWWLVLPEFPAESFWLDISAVLALGGPTLLWFFWWLRHGSTMIARTQSWEPDHG